MPQPPTEDEWRRWDLEPQWSRFVDVASHTGGTHRWHVLDTGVPDGADASSTPTVLCVHGNPTWGYAWATFLRRLHGRYRVIAVDQLGMGFSERVGRRRYADRVRDLDDVILALGLAGVRAARRRGPRLGWGDRHGLGRAGPVVRSPG